VKICILFSYSILFTWKSEIIKLKLSSWVFFCEKRPPIGKNQVNLPWKSKNPDALPGSTTPDDTSELLSEILNNKTKSIDTIIRNYVQNKDELLLFLTLLKPNINHRGLKYQLTRIFKRPNKSGASSDHFQDLDSELSASETTDADTTKWPTLAQEEEQKNAS
jgi:hypothetical protein